ncbi:hypothetical protein NI17_012160 [Thermobifida halotolerans]|uniref:Uncharacterized protein n=1 Tax=Thermobifida halotolerans TaxID=483545 RepID=A0A399G6G3_9ACTN|nr:hypothetical protein [Thermobifida halotolerans]UOE17668.1 hypothetical protein NI17_012160 [Thermobifida halotolerans]
MNAVSPISLTDLVPALRWSRPTDISAVLRHPRLVDGWWRSLPLPRVLDIAGPTWLAHCLARLAVEQWDHLEVCEFLPTLRGLAVDMDEIAEPVRGAVLATAGDWERLVCTSPQTMREWDFPNNCDVLEVVSTVMWRSVVPFTSGPFSGPAPSPALMIEAVRTIANWMPSSAPEHVHNALAYLTNATGADSAGPTTDSVRSTQTPATRAIRTLRALRAHRDRDLAAGEDGATASAHTPDSEEPVPLLARRGGSPLLGPGGTLRRPAFGPPKALRSQARQAAAVVEDTAPELGAHPLVDLFEQLCRDWSELERLIATERLFTSEPTSIRLLADQLQMDIGELRNAQRTVEERLLQWLSSPVGAPMARHLREVSDQLGVATTIDHLVNAHPDHQVDVPSLGIPLWRIVMTLFTDRRLDDNWLLAADTGHLRWQTRQLLSGQPSVTEAGLRLGKLGIRTQALRAWLLSTPGVSIQDGYVLVDESVPLHAAEATGDFGGHAAFPAGSPSMTTNGLPIRRRPAAESRPSPEPRAGVVTSARCFRAPDGRWWHRIDVTADQLNGAPVAVPPGYAAHLGLQPGRLLCLTGPGADLLVLVWRDQAAFDSLRPLLRRLGAQPGDRLFITVNGDRLDARLLQAAEVPADSGHLGRALSLIGYTAPASPQEAVDIIARRISEDDGGFAGGPAELLDLLSERGDDDIAEELRLSLHAVQRL